MAPSDDNLFASLPPSLPAELVDVIVQSGDVRIERIVSTGHATAPGEWYDQDRNEWVVVLRGSAGLKFENETAVRVLKPGDHVNIPAHRRHRVEWTDPSEPTVWLALFYLLTSSHDALRLQLESRQRLHRDALDLEANPESDP